MFCWWDRMWVSLVEEVPAFSLSPWGWQEPLEIMELVLGPCPAGSDCPHRDSTTTLGNLSQCLAVLMDKIIQMEFNVF